MQLGEVRRLFRQPVRSYRFRSVRAMKVTAKRVMATPVITLRVRDSLKKMQPTAMAVTGSATPRTEVLVAPMSLVEAARQSNDIRVGKMASPNRHSQQSQPCTPASRSPPEERPCPRNSREPNRRA